MDNQEKWDRRFIELARFYGNWSKDPSTKVGAHIVRPNRTPVSYGYNGFPHGVHDLPERLNDREIKYRMMVHAEENAILAAGNMDSLKGATIYISTSLPCARCATSIIQVGISTVVSPPTPDELRKRWEQDFLLVQLMFKEAGVIYREVDI